MTQPLTTQPPVFRSACFFSVNNGQTVQRRVSAADEAGGGILPNGQPAQGALPAGVTNLFRFDESQVNNAGLLQQWQSNAAAFSMAGNQVLVSGQPASFDAPGIVFEALQAAAADFAQALTANSFDQAQDARLRALVFFLARQSGVL
jgi:hypothetical protein